MTVMGANWNGVVTWNPNDTGGTTALSNGNLTVTNSSMTSGNARATKGISSGKWYWEIKYVTGNYPAVAIGNINATITSSLITNQENSRMIYYNGVLYPGTGTSYGMSFKNNTIGVALDMDLGTLEFYKDGVSYGIAWSDIKTLGTVYPMQCGAATTTANFGATPFAYPVPEGYQALDQSTIPIQISSGSVVSSLANMQIGDFIPCRYTSVSGAPGAFSELGTCNAAEIPVEGTATPDGLFYFVKVSKGTLVADRIVQTGVSWNTLNAAKYIEGALFENAIPVMTSDTAPNGIANSSSIFNGSYLAYKAFNRTTADSSDCWASANNSPTGWLAYNFTVTKTIVAYRITSRNYNEASQPKNWTFEGSNDGVTWEILDTQSNQTGWGMAEKRSYNIPSPKAFTMYRLNITANNGVTYTTVGELEMFEDYKVRSLSGGNSYIDANNNSSATDQGLKAWPPNNEFDTYLNDSDLNKAIQPGDGNVWHHGNVYTLCRETPIATINSSSNRIKRVGGLGVSRLAHDASTTVASNIGFRPILEYKE